MTASAVALVAVLCIAGLAGLWVWLARRDGATAARLEARTRDLERAEQIHKAAASARAVEPDSNVDQQLRDIGRLRD